VSRSTIGHNLQEDLAMRIRDLMDESCALVELQGGEKDECIAELLDVLAAAGRLKDRDQCLHDVLCRERRGPTCIGGGVAIPHAGTAGVFQPVLAIGRSCTGVPFAAADEEPAKLVFLLLCPRDLPEVHLRFLARIAEIIESQEAVEQLLKAEDSREVLAFLDTCRKELGEMVAPEDMPTVCVAGAGAGGLAMAAHLTLLGCRVNLYNRNAARIEPVQEGGGVRVSGHLNGLAAISLATTDPAQALEGADLVMVVIPASGHQEMAERLGPHLQDGQIVVLNPGRTGGVLEFLAVLKRLGVSSRPIVAEAGTLLYACRVVDPASVHVFGIKNAIRVAALPAYLTPEVVTVVGKCLPQFVPGDNVLRTSLDNIGSVFHPALSIMNVAWIEERHGDFEYYHEGASPSAARALEALDAERVAVAKALGIGAHTAREWLYLAYSASGKDLYEAIQSNPGYTGIRAPNRLNHRYITEDIPMSLVPMASLGEQVGVPVPTMRAFIHLASVLHDRDYWAEGRTVERLGLAGLSVREIRRLVVDGV